MPDPLNPDSLHAACNAMREAYRPARILLRTDAMEAAISAFLAAEAERGWALGRRGLPEFPDVERTPMSVHDIVAGLDDGSTPPTGAPA